MLQRYIGYHERNVRIDFPIGQVGLKLRYKGEETPEWKLLMVSPEEMNTLANHAGWKLDKVICPRNLYVGVQTRK